MVVVKILRTNGTPLYLNAENIVAVAVNGVVEVIYIGVCINAEGNGSNNKVILTLDEAQPLLDLLERHARKTNI